MKAALICRGTRTASNRTDPYALLSVAVPLYSEFQLAFQRSYLPTEKENACPVIKDSQDLTHYRKNDGKTQAMLHPTGFKQGQRGGSNWPEKVGPLSIVRISGFHILSAKEMSQSKNAGKMNSNLPKIV